MKDLLNFLVKNITGVEDFEISEINEDSFTTFIIKTKPGTAGLIIGKGGRTIKTIRNLLKIRATLEKKGVNISVEEA